LLRHSFELVARIIATSAVSATDARVTAIDARVSATDAGFGDGCAGFGDQCAGFGDDARVTASEGQEEEGEEAG
jgi:hypothetical protein